MRIAIFTDTYKPEINGVVTSVVQFSEILADQGHEIMIFCPKYKEQKERDRNRRNIKIRRFYSFGFIANTDVRMAVPSLFKVISDLRKFRADIIHIQTPMAVGLTALMAAKMMRIKNIQTYHTYIPEDMVYLTPKGLPGVNRILEKNSIKNLTAMKKLIESDVLVDDETDFKLKLAQERKKLPTKRNRNAMTDALAWNFTRAVYNKADFIITPTKIMKDELGKHGIKPRIEVVSNGIDMSLIPQKKDFTPKKKILHGGRLGLEKSVDIALAAFGIYATKDKDVTLDLTADGPAKQKLESMVKKMHLEKRVRFLGYLEREEMLKAYSKYDFLLNASTMETQGLIILEAMAAGLPILGVRKLAVPELVRDGRNGYISTPYHEKEIAQNIASLYENPDLFEKFGKTSIKMAEKHDLKICAEKLLEIYKEVIRIKHARAKTVKIG